MLFKISQAMIELKITILKSHLLLFAFNQFAGAS